MPFLTDIDSRPPMNGARDSLGPQAIWTPFGRYVVGGLATYTTTVRSFVVPPLGHRFSERIGRPGFWGGPFRREAKP